MAVLDGRALVDRAGVLNNSSIRLQIIFMPSYDNKTVGVSVGTVV